MPTYADHKYRFVITLILASAICKNLDAQIQRRLPPVGIEIPAEIHSRVSDQLNTLRAELKPLSKHTSAADADILLKAVEFALRHQEIYSQKQLPLLDETLEMARNRITSLKKDDPNWQNDKLTVRGFYSRIDDSPQPYGLVIPKDLPKDKPVPLYVWLHGRGDKTTDIHFIKQRLTKVGYVAPPMPLYFIHSADNVWATSRLGRRMSLKRSNT